MSDTTHISIKAVPGARRDQIAGMLGDRLKVRVAAPPEGGKANDAICALIAHALGVKPRHVQIVRGHTTAEKTIAVTGADPALLRALLERSG